MPSRRWRLRRRLFHVKSEQGRSENHDRGTGSVSSCVHVVPVDRSVYRFPDGGHVRCSKDRIATFSVGGSADVPLSDRVQTSAGGQAGRRPWWRALCFLGRRRPHPTAVSLFAGVGRGRRFGRRQPRSRKRVRRRWHQMGREPQSNTFGKCPVL